MNELKLVSWNVNGIRAVMNKGFIESIKELDADVFCLQETKAHPEQVDHKIKELGYEYEFWNSAIKKGYSGTAIFSKVEPINVSYGLGIEKHDSEGRVITAEFDTFYLVTVYTPNSKRALERLDYRYNEWDKDFLSYVKKLEEKKPVVFCGDLNVAHKEIDIKNSESNKTTEKKPGNAGFTDKEREGFDNILNAGFIDTFRELKPDEVKYSWWTYMFNSRANNTGWRIDYFCVSKSLKDKLVAAEIHNEVFGSDHCPVSIVIKL
jgi:exodeoxyribonuclease-3